jgi:hypothetical protein
LHAGLGAAAGEDEAGGGGDLMGDHEGLREGEVISATELQNDQDGILWVRCALGWVPAVRWGLTVAWASQCGG